MKFRFCFTTKWFKEKYNFVKLFAQKALFLKNHLNFRQSTIPSNVDIIPSYFFKDWNLLSDDKTDRRNP